MRLIGLLAISALIGAAQIQPQRPALLHGILVGRDTAPAGEFVIRGAADQTLRYRFDANTYVEDEQRMIDVPRLRPGEQVEVLSDFLANSSIPYARTIHVLYPAAPKRIARPRSGIEPAPDPFFRPDNLTYSGVVARFDAGSLQLHTRESGDQTLLLRHDTRFLAEGQIVAASELKPNMRVFVRAGKNGDGRLEVYQVMWGGILLPY